MVPVPDQPRPRPFRRVVAGVVLYCLFAPAALLALPLGGLILASRPRSRGDAVLAVVTLSFGAWWLWQPGDLADQVLRAAAVMGTTAFVLTSATTAWSVTHRALVSLTAATGAMAALLALVGRTWLELGWSVAHRTGFFARQTYAMLYNWSMNGTTQPSSATIEWLKGMSTWLDTSVQLMSAYYPAVIALQLLLGFWLATAVCRYLTTPAPGLPLGALREFRFTEHLGWGLAIPLIIFLIPRLAEGRIAAGNLLIVTAALYSLRGIAVVSFGLAATGAGGLMLSTAIVLAILFMSPFVVAGTVLLGVLDTGLDLRRRWSQPPAGE